MECGAVQSHRRTRELAEIRFGYHNHTGEFRTQDGIVLYDEVLRLTDPAKVTMELDCGWMIVGGKNPVDYLERYPTRFSLLHVKDFKMSGKSGSDKEPPPSAELGRGASTTGRSSLPQKKLPSSTRSSNRSNTTCRRWKR